MQALLSLFVQAATEEEWWKREYLWNMVQVILVLIAAMGTWWLATRRRNKVAKLLERIDRIHSTSPHASEREFLVFKDTIASELKKGGIDESSYLILDKRIDDYVREARERIIEERFSTLPSSLKNELKLMIDDGKVTEGEVLTFEKVLSKSSISDRDKGELRSLLSEWQTRKAIPTNVPSQMHEPQILSRIKKSLSRPMVVGRRKKG